MSIFGNFARRALSLLDRRGSRWLVSGVYTAAGRVSGSGLQLVRHDRGWVHAFYDARVVELKPRLRGPGLDDALTADHWHYLYEPRPGDTVADVGAGLGGESLSYARRVGPAGKVIAIEAHPVLAAMLERSARLNGLDNLICLNLAAADAPGTIYIEDDLGYHLGNTVSTDPAGRGIAVEARTLDSICDALGVGKVDFLKMNIEGAERLAILGMAGVIGRTAVVSISCHDFRFERSGEDFFRTKALVNDWLEGNGFVVVPRDDQRPYLRDQVNAYNPALIGPDELRPVARR